ncbi:hypothetical protein NEPAR04_1839 [Nematocida parisii]|nr:hypothetical protein NEPAR03_0574 [Nematocida parisii]KAI5130246.1 hypothetical protein NEPAR08_1930 [Nematocida parisii]KAI5143448.1 hypothetical protein NEPAR04_1839 [Nematocida parisii]KAI5157737.1 hypothetical protein NEPAR05_1544 [Nematocida parisii]
MGEDQDQVFSIESYSSLLIKQIHISKYPLKPKDLHKIDKVQNIMIIDAYLNLQRVRHELYGSTFKYFILPDRARITLESLCKKKYKRNSIHLDKKISIPNKEISLLKITDFPNIEEIINSTVKIKNPHAGAHTSEITRNSWIFKILDENNLFCDDSLVLFLSQDNLLLPITRHNPK